MKKSFQLCGRNMGLLLLFFILAASGCAKIQATRRADQFKSTLDSYSALLRWGKYKQAGNYINMREGVPRQPDLQYLKHIHVTRYDVVQQIATVDNEEEGKGPTEIAVAAEIDFYHDNDLRVKNIDYQQLWWYDDKLEKWYLDGDLPDFRLDGGK